MEQRSLEESLNLLMEEVTSNTKALQVLDSQLLERLSNSTSNLLDDTELIEVLGNTKAKAKEVEKKLKDAQEKKTEVRESRPMFSLLKEHERENTPHERDIRLRCKEKKKKTEKKKKQRDLSFSVV